MCRRSDRVQGRLRLAVVAFVVAGLVVTGLLAHRAYADGVRLQRADAVAGYHTTGRIGSASQPAVSPDGAVLRGVLRVSWQDRAGRTHRQVIMAPIGRPAPTKVVPLWVDARGRATTSPPTSGPATTAAVTVVLGTGLAVNVAALLYLLVMLPIERRRLAAWQAEWSVVEPGWRRQVL